MNLAQMVVDVQASNDLYRQNLSEAYDSIFQLQNVSVDEPIETENQAGFCTNTQCPNAIGLQAAQDTIRDLERTITEKDVEKVEMELNYETKLHEQDSEHDNDIYAITAEYKGVLSKTREGLAHFCTNTEELDDVQERLNASNTLLSLQASQ